MIWLRVAIASLRSLLQSWTDIWRISLRAGTHSFITVVMISPYRSSQVIEAKWCCLVIRIWEAQLSQRPARSGKSSRVEVTELPWLMVEAIPQHNLDQKFQYTQGAKHAGWSL